MLKKAETKSVFTREVRHALLSLYDPAQLRGSPLVSLFALTKHANPNATLREIIINAIRALNPGPQAPVHSSAWRIYQMLVYRYVEQSDQQTVAHNLAISVRQLQRLEREAEQVLADYLWECYGLDSQGEKLPALLESDAEDGPPIDSLVSGLEQELTWLQKSSPIETAGIGEIVRTALKTVKPLAQQTGVTIKADIATEAGAVTGQLVILRQALRTLLEAAVYAATGGQMRIAVEIVQQATVLRLQALRGHPDGGSLASEIGEHMEMACKLASLFDGAIVTTLPPTPETSLSVTLTLPQTERVPVLVIEDNADTLRLVQRYLSGTRFQFTGAQDPEQVLSLAQQTTPRVIVMDVMMPGMDGWELLGRLLTHPATRHVPIIICTILPEQPLALSLGAAAFLRKPIRRDTLLSALERQIGLLSKG